MVLSALGVCFLLHRPLLGWLVAAVMSNMMHAGSTCISTVATVKTAAKPPTPLEWIVYYVID